MPPFGGPRRAEKLFDAMGDRLSPLPLPAGPIARKIAPRKPKTPLSSCRSNESKTQALQGAKQKIAASIIERKSIVFPPYDRQH